MTCPDCRDPLTKPARGPWPLRCVECTTLAHDLARIPSRLGRLTPRALSIVRRTLFAALASQERPRDALGRYVPYDALPQTHREEFPNGPRS